jgi:hypothetical protein
MAGQITISTLRNDTGVLATQNGMTGICKAWINYKATTTAAIRDSFNVSSVTTLSTGKYQINFTTAMPNANYCFTFGQQPPNDVFYSSKVDFNQTYSTTNIQISTGVSTSATDALSACVAIFSS